MYSYLAYRKEGLLFFFMTTERNLASVSQSWFKLSHSASESKHKNVKKYIHCIISPINNVECEYIVKKVVYYPWYPLKWHNASNGERGHIDISVVKTAYKILPLRILSMKGLNMWRYWRMKFKGNSFYHINCGVIQRFPALRKVVTTLVKKYRIFSHVLI